MKWYLFLLLLLILSSSAAQEQFLAFNTREQVRYNHVKAETYYGFYNVFDSTVACINLYDIHGFVTSIKVFSLKGQLVLNDTFVYDSRHHLLERTSLDSRGSMKERLSRRYNAKGHCVQEIKANFKERDNL